MEQIKNFWSYFNQQVQVNKYKKRTLIKSDQFNYYYRYYFAHIIQAVEEMHSKGIVHRDLKAENIMVTKENKIKLIDFGTAKDEFHPEITGAGQGGKKKKNYQHFVGTPNYMAPEQIRNKGSSYETDIFALAGVAYQLWGGFPAFNGGSEYLIFKEILNEDPVFPECIFAEQPQLQDLIMKMCKREMEDRITIKDIKKHPFWSGFRWELLNEIKLSDLDQGQSKKEQFLQEIRDNFINNQQKYYQKDQLFVEEFNKYIIRYQQDPDFNQDQLLKQRLKIMKAQGRLLVDPENCVFNWKDHVQNTVTVEKQQQQKQKQNIENEKQQNSQDDSSSSDTDDQDEKEQQKNKQNNNQTIEESQKDKKQQQQKEEIQQIQEKQ
ncbi:Protein kinase-like domain [Pseudocohnilembus persalinus]|uniref:Protein kinase-like domain n=1 Tax=Pseudocohnilembus persalinus TaxID=266149 RepID=A0A0V0R224_PSEPJ|nr:Protein kinase-like domain [Pseudocohnilembus persalinus]|eukprot:KRX08566.1 Protein kinase-like domain [Pseudocohnilembus persalinus]